MAIVCKKKLEVKVLKSAAGFYIGTVCFEEGFEYPNCRISASYFKTREEAQKRLDSFDYDTREEYASEVQFCNENDLGGCRIHDDKTGEVFNNERNI